MHSSIFAETRFLNLADATHMKHIYVIDGKAIKIASMIDEHTRCSLLNIVERSITAERLVTELEAVFTTAGGPPKALRMDNGPELVSQALQRFCANKTGIVYIPPGWRVASTMATSMVLDAIEQAIWTRRQEGVLV
jgi:transposase InsO family protein